MSAKDLAKDFGSNGHLYHGEKLVIKERDRQVEIRKVDNQKGIVMSYLRLIYHYTYIFKLY